MKINDVTQKAVALGLDKTETQGGKKADGSKAEPGSASSVTTLSSMSSQLQSLESKVAADNVFDADKVDAIKSAIASGQFRVDSEKVADGLIDTVKQLLASK